jgi:H+/Cl- antiporter ClcA
MGTAIGDGVVECSGKEKHAGWRRYIMTGGAASGFSIATSSPISAIIFSMEELHKHFSPLLLTVASLSVTSAQITMRILASFGIGSIGMFHVLAFDALSLKLVFVPLIIGVIVGVVSILFSRFYQYVDKLMRAVLEKLSVKIIFPLLFAAVAVVGFFIADTLGSGHSLIESLIEGNGAWYMLILVFLIRAISMMLSNTSGTTGGVFLPTLAFGAITGALSAKAMVALGWVSEEHYAIMVILGIVAFLGASSRIPLTACVFAVEALGGMNNILYIIIAVTTALLVVEMSGVEDFTDTVIEAKLHRITKGKSPSIFVAPLVVKPGSFVVGKEMRDVLWPHDTIVVAFKHSDRSSETTVILEGDVITLRYRTYNPYASLKEFEALVGKQTDGVNAIINPDIDIVANN